MMKKYIVLVLFFLVSSVAHTQIMLPAYQGVFKKIGLISGSTITFTYNGASVTYGTVISAGRYWLDRNLGATQVATSSTDASAYGDLFQWGRGADGHQIRTSSTTTTLSATDIPGNASFIKSSSNWRSTYNNNLWQDVNGINNPCPSGYRIPTETEINVEIASWSTINAAGALASPLKLPLAGYRNLSNGTLANVGGHGRYWSATVSGINVRNLYDHSAAASIASNDRAWGFSVRCIKD
jgi:uncharacterized protein (TIGR02145 family)